MSMGPQSESINAGFKQRIDVALKDDALQGNLRRAMDFLVDKRALQFPDTSAFETLQAEGRRIRQRNLEKLPELLERLESRCTENGIRVHWAETADEACRIISTLLKDANANTLIKGKSMASEEIALNAALERQGIDAIESDMGEYIVQLDGTGPSHIIMPAIHKTREEIARLFHERLHTDYTDDVDALIGIGREVLRSRFQQADAGLSGVNFAIAEEGALCLVENEGNGRMSTTIPPLHIALCGIEKVVATLEDIPPLLNLLTKSATGQAITTYVNLIRGPRQKEELDGPRAVHLVLLDNGRSRMFADQRLRETLRCIRCGACMNHCPVYTRLGGHAYGSTYPGPIGQVVMPQIEGIHRAGELTQACSLNGSCGEVCPVGIPLPGLIRQLRHEANETDSRSGTPGKGQLRKPLESLVWKLWALVHARPTLYRFMCWLASRGRTLLPRQIGPWTRTRSSPRPAPRTLHDHLRHRNPKNRRY